MKQVPEDFESIGFVMSNFDHEIEEDAEQQLKEGEVYGEYAAWNFWGAVWFDNQTQEFFCMIKQYRYHVDTVVAETLEDIMQRASDRYGHG